MSWSITNQGTLAWICSGQNALHNESIAAKKCKMSSANIEVDLESKALLVNRFKIKSSKTTLE